jgi:hypothetical protein
MNGNAIMIYTDWNTTAPTQTLAIADQTTSQNSPFRFVVPSNTFIDPDPGDFLVYTATLADGSPLPSWLTFISSIKLFNGTPGSRDVGTLDIKVTATDRANTAAADTFTLQVTPALPTPELTGDDFLPPISGRAPIVGGDGNDELLGGNNDDILIGGNGADTLVGGAGRDLFGYGSLSEGQDTIVDFSFSEDLIDLRSLFSQPQFAGATPYARYLNDVQLLQIGSNTEVQIDADGNGAGNTFVTLTTLTNVAASTLSSCNFVIG